MFASSISATRKTQWTRWTGRFWTEESSGCRWLATADLQTPCSAEAAAEGRPPGDTEEGTAAGAGAVHAVEVAEDAAVLAAGAALAPDAATPAPGPALIPDPNPGPGPNPGAAPGPSLAAEPQPQTGAPNLAPDPRAGPNHQRTTAQSLRPQLIQNSPDPEDAIDKFNSSNCTQRLLDLGLNYFNDFIAGLISHKKKKVEYDELFSFLCQFFLYSSINFFFFKIILSKCNT